MNENLHTDSFIIAVNKLLKVKLNAKTYIPDSCIIAVNKLLKSKESLS
jgi:hypothetical protein